MNIREALEAYAESDAARFHMPGHKGALNPFDITELSFSDNLHAPSGIILELEQKVAAFYSAADSHLLVNGSTCGTLAFMLTLSKRETNVLVSRDCHSSVINGAALAGSSVMAMRSMPTHTSPITPEIVADGFKKAKLSGVFISAACITSPNYYGMCADIKAIAEIAHSNGALLFVDAAHGAHFPLIGIDSLRYADAYVVSCHKTLCAMNQSAALLINDSSRLPRGAVKAALRLVETTSPSYPLLLSIHDAVSVEKSSWQKHLERISRFREKLSRNGIKTLMPQANATHDITRLCILTEGFAGNGYELSRLLRSNGIFVEMEEADIITCITTPYDKDEWYERMLRALTLAEKSSAPRMSGQAHPSFCESELIGVRAAMREESASVPLLQAASKRSAGLLSVIPPCIAVALPGEVLTEDACRYIMCALENGCCVLGLENGMARVLCD